MWAASFGAPPRSFWCGRTKAWQSACVAAVPKSAGMRVMENGSPVALKVEISHSPLRWNAVFPPLKTPTDPG